MAELWKLGGGRTQEQTKFNLDRKNIRVRRTHRLIPRHLHRFIKMGWQYSGIMKAAYVDLKLYIPAFQLARLFKGQLPYCVISSGLVMAKSVGLVVVIQGAHQEG